MDWPSHTVAELQEQGILLVEDGNHGEYRPRPDEFVEDGIAFIRATDMSDGQVLFEQAGHITEIARERVRKGVGKPGDVLFSHKGTVGKLARVPVSAPEFVCSPQTTFWRTLDESRLCRDYLYSFMRSKAFINQWLVRKGETDMADYVSLTAQRQLRVVVPPVEIQHLIAAPITAIDDLIDNNRRRIEVLEEMAQAIYREWFVHFRFPGHENATFVDSPLGPIPEDWEIAPLSRIAAVTRSTVHPSERPDETFRHYSIPAYDEYRLPVVELGDEIRSGKYEVVEPCVLLSKLNPRIPRTWYFDAVSDIPAVASTEFLVLTTQPGCSLEHIYLSVSAPDFQARLQALTGGTSGSHQRAKPGDVMALELVVPPPEIIDTALFWSAPSLSLQRSLIEQNARLALVRDLLLPRLVSGEIDVSDLDLDAVLEGAV